jgi:chemotaxis protein methyltransferase CheR
MSAVLSPPAPMTGLDAGERGGSEFEFGKADFERVRSLIYARAGINLHAGKHAMVYSRLSRRLRETGHRSFSQFLDALERANDAMQWQEFVNCLTTNLTAFFREDHHFAVLAEELNARSASPVRIWCNAASTGEEPYSLAMTVIETLGSGANASILATDIDTKVLATASQGIYGADSRGLDADRLRAHFLRGKGANAGKIRIKPGVARLVDFRTFNLMDARWSFAEPFDIVFCRNVMIYFDGETQRRVLERIREVMRPGGVLFVGHSENFTDSRDLFRLRGKTVYERL